MYIPIDFTRIRGDMPEGQRGAFEELVCQLARSRAPDPKSFRRIEGAGGDGGVECIHRAFGEGIVGYQAKYHCKSSDIDWQAIDKSVDTALATYPELVTYVIAIACDFTGRRRVKGGTISDGTWGEWDTHVVKWQAEAANKSRSVEFIPWTADELHWLLMPSEAAGLRTFWFGETEFSNNWFRTRVELAVAALDERYNPNDHVDVRLQSLFEFVIRHPKARENIGDHFKAITKISFPEHRLRSGERRPPDELITRAVEALEKLMVCERELMSPVWESWSVEKWAALTNSAATKLGDIRNWAWNADTDLKGPEHETDRRYLKSLFYELGEIYSGLQSLHGLLKGCYLKAEAKRAALITGRAGTGKSHLLARVAELALCENRPVIFILGQQLREQTLWPQIVERLGLRDVSAEEFLGALNVAAESACARGLILVDAINEGPGARLWRGELASFLAHIERYPNLACVLSCRSEYIESLVPPAVLKSLPQFEVRGFETPEEQAEAARVYLDKRGISRPATPWLAPEFVNPLFLRSCCNALQQEHKTEFPRGLTGTKEIFAFFLDSTAKHLGVERDGTNELVGATKSTLRQMAVQMAGNRKDYLARNSAEEIAEASFRPFKEPTGLSWLEVLQKNGLLRFDPDPAVQKIDPLLEPFDVVRFSFQRFQDHLMAEALLSGINDIKAALKTGGSLCFMHNGKDVAWEWRGLFEALSVQLPERFEIELVDALPGASTNWWRSWQVRDAFAESIRWRTTTAFTQRTLDLFNSLGFHNDRFSLLADLAASVNHPWNSELIHRNLTRKKMAERDAFWTVEINKATNDDSHAIQRLIDWCLHTQGLGALSQTQWLCALVLTWCFTASNRRIRDRATKALTALLLTRADIFPKLLDAFQDVDDLYVLERLYAAAYGACCIDPSHERVRVYAQVTFHTVFNQKVPPENLLLRDYARGIVDLTYHVGVLPNEVDITRCHPPYVSRLPNLEVTDAALKKITDKAGDTAILSSCDSYGDFGRYEIEPSVNKFVAVKLSSPPPYTSREEFERFENEVVGNHSDRIAALERLQEAKFSGTRIIIQFFGKKSKKPRKPTKAAIKRHALQVRTAEQNLLKLLTPEERRRYRVEAKPWLNSEVHNKKSEPLKVDVAAAKRWVARNAYGYGWNKQLFQHESGSSYEYKNDRSLVERIGKKYQWLALSKLLCGLSDNYWIGGTLGDGTRRYDNPTDIGFLRDIDPTIVPHLNSAVKAQDQTQAWILGPNITIPSTPEDELTVWPFRSDPGKSFSQLVSRVGPEGTKWSTLYDYRGVTTRYEQATGMQHGTRQQEFRLIFCVVVNQADRARLIDYLKNKRKIDVHHWNPPELTDGPYLYEAPWRTTWPQMQWQSDEWATPKDLAVAFPVYEYLWESHLDASLPEGARAFVPSPWLTVDLGLSPGPTDISIYRDSSGKCQFIGCKGGRDGSSALIGTEMFDSYLGRHGLNCIWLLVAERGSWPGGHNENAAWRRTEGICWVEDGKPTAMTWNEDRVNGR
jgi:SAM-dependent methyltransferase